MKNKVVKLLKEKGMTISSIESLTGGLFASTITSVPGVSSVFKGCVVTYATEIKQNVIGVSKEVVEEFGVISKECALEMVKGGKELLNTDVVVSFTGNAGPDTMENKKVGTVFIGLLVKEEIEIVELNLLGDRNFIRNECVNIAFNKIFEKISRDF
jgi:PncC family amidohydrolase